MRRNYTIAIGVVTKTFPHKKKGDTGHYQCDVRLTDSEQSLSSVPVATQCIGLASTPQVDDVVLVAFINGDLYMPVVIGMLYATKVEPPLYLDGEMVYVCPQTDKSDPPQKELKRFYVELPGGMKLTVRDEDLHYEYEKYKFDLKKEDGLKLEVNEKTSLAISKDGDITITASSTKVSIKKDGEIVIDSQKNVGVKTTGNVELASSAGDLKLKGNNITLEGTVGVNVKAAKLDINANASADIKTSGIMNIKGSMVNIN